MNKNEYNDLYCQYTLKLKFHMAFLDVVKHLGQKFDTFRLSILNNNIRDRKCRNVIQNITLHML